MDGASSAEKTRGTAISVCEQAKESHDGGSVDPQTSSIHGGVKAEPAGETYPSAPVFDSDQPPASLDHPKQIVHSSQASTSTPFDDFHTLSISGGDGDDGGPSGNAAIQNLPSGTLQGPVTRARIEKEKTLDGTGNQADEGPQSTGKRGLDDALEGKWQVSFKGVINVYRILRKLFRNSGLIQWDLLESSTEQRHRYTGRYIA